MQKQLTNDDIKELAARLIRCDKSRLRINTKMFVNHSMIGAGATVTEIIVPLFEKKSNTLYFIDEFIVTHWNAEVYISGEMPDVLGYVDIASASSLDKVSKEDIFKPYFIKGMSLTHTAPDYNPSVESSYSTILMKCIYYEISLI